MDFRRLSLSRVIFPVISLFFAIPAAHSASGSRTLVEDFSDIDHADLAQSTGFWDVSDGMARAAVMANGDSTRPLNFGRGGDGVLVTSNGITFDTTAHPAFEFRSISITGGIITVLGTNPLILRSLGPVTITPPLDVGGGTGGNGTTATQATPLAGGTRGSAITTLASGGSGGISRDVTSVDREGLRGMLATGVEWTFITRARGNTFLPEGAASPALDGASGQDSSSSTVGDFDLAGSFIGGSGGGAGGAYLNTGGGTLRAGGAGGGAGGGVIQIVAGGPIQLGVAPLGPTILAHGGKGGDRAASPGATLATQCSGAGGGGAGGAIWLQTLQTIATTSVPEVDGGLTGGLTSPAPCSAATQAAGLAGLRRGDQGSGGAPWSDAATCGAAAGCGTQNAAANQTYAVVSHPYDLKTFNAFFPDTPHLTQTLNGGAIQILFSGSSDGARYGDETSTLSDLSYKNFRYLRFRILITTAGAIAPSPFVKQISFTYDDAGPAQLDVNLGAGCGSLRASPWSGLPPSSGSSGSDPARDSFGLFLAGFFAIWAVIRFRAPRT